MSEPMKRPNIVFILTDDQGYWSLGCYGNKEIKTPNLDRLAKSGMRFDNFYCASPVCSPARASIFTGHIPSRHGVRDWIHSGHVDESQLDEELLKQIYNPDSPKEYQQAKGQLKGDAAIDYIAGETCYTDLLAEAGYTCGLSGKWHLGDSGHPRAGFSYWKTIAMGGDNYFYPTVLQDGRFRMMLNTYLTDYITDNALEFMDSCKDSDHPFYLSVHYTAPHSPWNKDQHPERIYQQYENCPFESVPNLPAHPWSIYHRKSMAEFAEFRRTCLKGYYAAVTAMDENVGRLLDYLEDHNLLEDTIIFFTGDNGMNMGHHGIIGKGNGTYPLNMYETSVRVPALVSWKGKIAPESTSDALLSHYDIFPTLADLLDLPAPDDSLPGKSFAAVLRGQPLNQDSSVVIYDEYGATRMIRSRQWKYIRRYPDGPNELYHLLTDPDELRNLADTPYAQPVCEQLEAQMEEWFSRYSCPEKDGKNAPVTGLGQTGLNSFAPFTPYD